MGATIVAASSGGARLLDRGRWRKVAGRERAVQRVIALPLHLGRRQLLSQSTAAAAAARARQREVDEADGFMGDHFVGRCLGPERPAEAGNRRNRQRDQAMQTGRDEDGHPARPRDLGRRRPRPRALRRQRWRPPPAPARPPQPPHGSPGLRAMQAAGPTVGRLPRAARSSTTASATRAAAAISASENTSWSGTAGMAAGLLRKTLADSRRRAGPAGIAPAPTNYGRFSIPAPPRPQRSVAAVAARGQPVS